MACRVETLAGASGISHWRSSDHHKPHNTVCRVPGCLTTGTGTRLELALGCALQRAIRWGSGHLDAGARSLVSAPPWREDCSPPWRVPGLGRSACAVES